MGTYRTTPLPGARDGDGRLLGVNSLGQAAFLTRACAKDDAAMRGRFEKLRPLQSDCPDLAGLVEVADDDSGIWVVEVAFPAYPLPAVLDRARQKGTALPPEAAVWLAMRLCRACASVVPPHLRVTPRNVMLRPDGTPYLLGAGWARWLPARPEEEPYVPTRPPDELKLDAFAAAQLARWMVGSPSAFPAGLRSALESASGGPTWSWMLTASEAAAAFESALGPSAGASQAKVAAFLKLLDLPPFQLPEEGGAPLRLVPILRRDSHDELLMESGPSITLDGRIEGKHGPPRPAAAPPTDAPQPRVAAVAADEELELDSAAMAHAFTPKSNEAALRVRVEMAQARARRRSRRLAVAFALLLVGGLAAGGLWLARNRPQDLRRLMQGPQTALLRIDSTPPGATVRINGDALGETPFVGTNDYGDATAVIELSGYEPARVPVKAGGSQTLSVKLVPAKKAPRGK